VEQPASVPSAEGFSWILRRSLRTRSKELKKYAVFSKVTIAADDEHVLLGVAGFQARARWPICFRPCRMQTNSGSAKVKPPSVV
jgi:folate-binding Fe-S cluster repair protein YgfZ